MIYPSRIALAASAVLGSLGWPLVPLAAQHAAPRGETAPAEKVANGRARTADVWRGEDACALSMVRWFAAQQVAAGREGRRARPFHFLVPQVPESVRPGWARTAAGALVMDSNGYRYGYFVADAEGKPTRDAAASPDGGWCLYAWPVDPEAGAGKVFFASHHGVVLVSENDLGYRAGDGPQPQAAFGRGAAPTIEHALKGSGVGQDGQLWASVDTVRSARQVFQVVDEDGAAVVGMDFVVRPNAGRAPSADGVPVALPVGFGSVGEGGRMALSGPLVENVSVAISVGSQDVAPTSVDVKDGVVRVEFELRAVRAAQLRANESAAIAALKNISSAQAQCQASGVIDANQNGAGEYGFFGELSGAELVRAAQGQAAAHKITPPVLSGAFGNVEKGRVVRSGYVFQIFLPGAKFAPIPEADNGGGAGRLVGASESEVVWCAYAWPVRHGVTGGRGFFVNQSGDVLACQNASGGYSGDAAPDPMSALVVGDDPALASQVAANREGSDGQRWTVVN